MGEFVSVILMVMILTHLKANRDWGALWRTPFILEYL